LGEPGLDATTLDVSTPRRAPERQRGPDRRQPANQRHADFQAHGGTGLSVPVADLPGRLRPGSHGHRRGIAIDDAGKVLLVEPKNHFGGYVWTFPKGRPEANESPDQTAIREVFEESAVVTSFVCPIVGAYRGGTTLNRYFLMRPEGKGDGAPDKETVSVTWASYEEARELIGKTENAVGQRRDQVVLAQAFRAWMEARPLR
jgi:8-oxo-dGTP diphosphatase